MVQNVNIHTDEMINSLTNAAVLHSACQEQYIKNVCCKHKIDTMPLSQTINRNGKEKMSFMWCIINKCDYKWERSADLGKTLNYLEMCLAK